MIRVVNGKVAIFTKYMTGGEDIHDTVNSLIGLLQSADENIMSQTDIYHVAELLREFTPSIEQWQLIFDNEKKHPTKISLTK